MSTTLTRGERLRELVCGPSAKHLAKQCHPIPDFAEVDRAELILRAAKGKTVLDIGASGPLHDGLTLVAAQVYGIDRCDGPGVVGVDLDDYWAELPRFPGVELVVCGEVLEHLSNPGWFLDRLLAFYQCPKIFSVPNAGSEILQRRLKEGIEAVNLDHVCWYSWHTLKVLLERHKYTIRQWHWYGGTPKFAEGLIAITE